MDGAEISTSIDLDGSAGAESALWHAYWADRGNDALRNQLVELYKEWAFRIGRIIASSYRSCGVDSDDCASAAVLGLVRAVELYRPGPAKFKSYATFRVRGEVLNALSVYSEGLSVAACRRSLNSERVDFILGSLGADENPVEALIDGVLDIATGLILTSAEVVAVGGSDELYCPSERAVMSYELLEIAGSLPEPYQTIITKHYFLDSSFVDIARDMGVSRARVSQLHREAMACIRARYSESREAVWRAKF